MFLSTLGIIYPLMIVIVTSLKLPGICEEPCPGGIHDWCVKCPSPCPETCTKPTESQVCALGCFENGCECAPGYVREKGQCILPSQCPTNSTSSSCSNCNGPNMECSHCYNSCRKTCKNILYPLDPVEPCLISCGGNYCVCADGYYLADDGECVMETDCIWHSKLIEPPVLPPPIPICNKLCDGGFHDKCVLCGSKCPLTCDNLDSPPVCTADCASHVCRCDDGYVRNSDGECVLPKNCPPKPIICY